MGVEDPGPATEGPPGPFPTTLWTVVLRAGEEGAPERRRALETLIRLYWKPLYHFVRHKGNDAEKSADLVQGFFTALLAREGLQRVDRRLGKFRTFLLASFGNYMADEHDRATALKRGGGAPLLSLDYRSAESEVFEVAGDDMPPEEVYTREWALRVLSQALENLRREYEQSGKPAEFDAFRRHLGHGTVPRPSYQEIGQSLGLSESLVRNRLHDARRRYAEAILDVIRSYTESEADAQEELRDLFKAFASERSV